MEYMDFLKTKSNIIESPAKEIDGEVNPILFGFQRDIVLWALKKSRSCIFADTGLGKTFMQLEWARLLDEKTIIISPLMVVAQTKKEAVKLGMEIGDVGSNCKIHITNYEQIGNIPDDYNAVVLDESSILKSIGGKTRKLLNEKYAATPYKLCCTATPAPNDPVEITNHIEFLGHMKANEAKSMFFVNDSSDSQKWRLKGHAERPFYRWLASWSMSVRMPSDLGYSNDGYELPPYKVSPVFAETVDMKTEGHLFFMGLKGISSRSKIRKQTIEQRINVALELIQSDDEQWIIWCGLNDEGRQIHKMIPGSSLMEGTQKNEVKIQKAWDFIEGKTRILITKPKMMRFGMNLQNCHKMIFLGMSDSWEEWYQCIRRCYRFGQSKNVEVYPVLSDAERAIYDNVMRKQKLADDMRQGLIDNVREFERLEIKGDMIEMEYTTGTIKHDEYTIMKGDSAERLKEVKSDSVGLSVFSPPFASLYTYTPSDRDLGNSKNNNEFFTHFKFIIDELLRVTMPGRNACVHVAQVAAMLVRDGYIGIKDFRGDTIRAFQESGWIFHGEVCIDKNPQAQAIRTHSKGLLFAQLKKDASWLRPALADFVLIFRKPGENPEAVHPDISNDDWISWAHPIWYDIRETDTLNKAEARECNDERHVCPLQLGLIERCIRLWSNPGDTVLSPFMGIGSELYQALKFNRRGIGIELKPSYFETAKKNMERAITSRENESKTLFNREA